MSNFISFIIPSIGRESLKDTLQSLINLSSNDWTAKVIFDGVKENSINILNNNKIEKYFIDKVKKKD